MSRDFYIIWLVVKKIDIKFLREKQKYYLNKDGLQAKRVFLWWIS